MKYFKFSNKLFALLFMITSIMYVGCQKEEQKILKSEDQLSTELRVNVQPTVENGTLKFETKESAFKYMTYLSDLIQQKEEQELDSETDTKQTLLSDIEEKLGFRSLYSVSEKDENGYIVNPLFSDVSFNLLLNEYYEVIIGDEIFVHKSNSEYYSIKSSDVTNRITLRKLKINESLSLKDLNPGIKIFEFDNKKTVIRSKDCDCNLSIRPGVPPPGSNVKTFVLSFDCTGYTSNNLTYTVYDINSNRILVPTSNGTVISLNPSPITFNIPSEFNGNFRVEFCIMLDCNGVGPKQYCFNISGTANENCCSKFETIEKAEPFPPDMEFYSKYQNGTNIFGYYIYGLCGFKKPGAGGKFFKAKNEIWLNAIYRLRAGNDGLLDMCTKTGDDNAYDSCKNCKSLSERIYTTQDENHHKNGEVVCDYRGNRNSNIGSNHIVPTFCN
jgi:hypothetical protein